MKNFYATLIALFSILSAFAADNSVKVNNGSWNTASTWTLNHVPQDSETIIVPAGITLIVDNNVKMTSATINLVVYGTLHFVVGKLDLGRNSVVYVKSGGQITTKQGNPSDKIAIGGNVVYNGSQGTVPGPVTLSYGPEPIALPVKFVAYNVAAVTGGVSIQWSTEEEKNADKYIIERSGDGSNWNSIGTVAAVGNSSNLNNYSFTDKITSTSKVAYYRVKQVDIDGHFVYTSIKAIKSGLDAAADVKVSTSINNVVVEFAKQFKGNVVVRFVSLSGQVIAQQTYTQPSGYVILNKPSLKGNYIVSISNGQDLKIAKQVIF